MDNAVARHCLSHFLLETKGVDLWQHTPERNQLVDWTCWGWQSQDGRNIIDRIIVSCINLADLDIRTDVSWIPGIDPKHRSQACHGTCGASATWQTKEW